MRALGMPTTRSLAVVATGDRSCARALPGAVLARVASSHLRVGSFQYSARAGDTELCAPGRPRDRPASPGAADSEQPYLALFDAVIAAQAH